MSSNVDQEEALEQLQLSLAELLSPPGDEQTPRSLERLARTYLEEVVSTSFEANARHEGLDTLNRFLPDVQKVFARLEELESLANQWLDQHRETFEQFLLDWLRENLTYHFEDGEIIGGPGQAQALLEALMATLTQIEQALAAIVQRRQREQEDGASALERTRQEISRLAKEAEQRLSLGQSLGMGLGMPALAVMGLGALTLVSAALFWLMAVLALSAVFAGIFWTYRALFRPTNLSRKQGLFLSQAQKQLEREVELRLYRTLDRFLNSFRQVVQQNLDPISAWQDSLHKVDDLLVNRRRSLAERRQKRAQQRMRFYLEDDDIIQWAQKLFLDKDTTRQALLRCLWKHEEEWQPVVYAMNVATPEPSQTELVFEALYELAYGYAAALRQVNVADALKHSISPEELANQSALQAAPLIRTWPHKQSEARKYGLLAVAGQHRADYMREALTYFHQPATARHSRQLVDDARFPYHCTYLTSLDLLRPAGLPVWERVREAYTHLRGEARSALHLFPAEINAARWESALPKLKHAPVLFTPYTTFLLENERRAAAFWLAYGLGWVQPAEEQVGARTERWWSLNLPEQPAQTLTKPVAAPPSLWLAAANHNLGRQGGPVEWIERALVDHIGPPVNWRDMAKSLENEWRPRTAAYDKLIATDSRAAQLPLLVELAMEDLIRRLYRERPLLTWLQPDWLATAQGEE